MGFEDEAEQSIGRPCRHANGRSKRTYELTSSIVPRGTPFHRLVELEFLPNEAIRGFVETCEMRPHFYLLTAGDSGLSSDGPIIFNVLLEDLMEARGPAVLGFDALSVESLLHGIPSPAQLRSHD